MDNNIGFSLFQGNNDIQVRNEEIDEEEEKADQIRRNNELAENLDKYLEIEDDTMDHNNQSLFDSNFENDGGGGGGDIADLPRFENELCRLRHELIAKNNELVSFTTLLQTELHEKDMLIKDMKKRLDIEEAEKDRAIMTRNQTHELLIESKTQISNIENQEKKLRQKVLTLEEENSKLTVELQQTKTMLSDLQHRHHILELDFGSKKDARIDSVVKQLQEKHSAQIELLQEQIDTLTAKVEDKDHEIKNLDIRYKEVQRSREALLLDKTDVINQLANKLEETQRQLVNVSNMSQENLQLKKTASALEQRTEEMQRTIRCLTEKLETTSSELNVLESIVGENNLNDSVGRMATMKQISSTPMDSGSRILHLKNELYRALNNQKEYREKNKELEKTLLEKDDEIRRLREIENQALIDANIFKDTQSRLTMKVDGLKEELFRLENERADDERHQMTTSDSEKNLQQEISHLKVDLQDALEDCERVKNLYIETCDEKQRIMNELHSLKNSISNSKEQNDSCTKCSENFSKIRKLEIDLLETRQSNQKDWAEIDSLNQQVQNSRKIIDELNSKLEIKEYHDNLITELKAKAEKFEQFMNRTYRSVQTSPMKSSSTSDYNSNKIQSDLEQKIREEMAKLYAVEIKSLEKANTERINSYEETIKSLQSRLNSTEDSLKIKLQEIETLKCIILKEREQLKEIINAKDQNTKAVLVKQSDILRQCRAELETYQKKMATLIIQLNEKTEIIQFERQEILTLRKKLEDEQSAHSIRETELLQRIERLALDHEAAVTHLKEKYHSTRKTAQTYKLYSEEKEKHMLKEYERLKEGYKEASQKMENKMKSLLHVNEQKYNEKLHEVRMDYVAKLNALKAEKRNSQETKVL